jgi:hypothetical protein
MMIMKIPIKEKEKRKGKQMKILQQTTWRPYLVV